eukprot:11267495-Alexandrium_andersonii.AAC.1
MEPSPAKKVVAIALAQLHGATKMGGGGRSSEPEPDEEESPEPGGSKSNESHGAEEMTRKAGSELEEGEWTRI